MQRSLTPADKTKAMIEGQYGPRFIMDRYASGLLAQQNAIADFWLNHAFLLGFQWTYVEERTGLVREVPQDAEREQVVINRIWPNMRIIIAKLTQRELTFENPPSGGGDGTIRAARIGEQILRSTKEDHDWEGLREKAAMAALKGGTSIISIDWDPAAGHVTVGPTGDSSEIRGGDTIEQVHTIAEFVVEPGVLDARYARWWIKAEALPPETVQSMYSLPETPPADVTAGTSGIMRKLISSAGLSSLTSQGSAGSDDLTLVLTYYERPNQQAPDGRWSVVVNGQIVEGEQADDQDDDDADDRIRAPWPFPWTDRLNIVPIRETIVENEWMGRTVMSMARGVQASFNATWSSIIEHLRLAGNARLAVPESAMDLIEEFTDLPGEVVPFPDGTNPPFYLQPAQLPGWLIDTPVNLALQLDDIMGVHDISRGVAPANVESGFGISILAEQDSTPIGRLSKEIAKAFTEIARMALQLFEAEVKDTRESIVQNDGDVPMVTRWTGKDLLGQTRAYVPLESIVPRNRAAQLQLAKELQAGGLITTLDEFIAIADLADSSQILEKVSPDTARARRENHRMVAGKIVIPQDWDDHAIHIREHNILRKSTDFEMMTAEERNVVNLHIAAHETLAAGEAGQMEAAMAIGGPALAQAPTANEIPVPEEFGGMGPGDLATMLGEAPPSGDTVPDVAMPPLV